MLRALIILFLFTSQANSVSIFKNKQEDVINKDISIIASTPIMYGIIQELLMNINDPNISLNIVFDKDSHVHSQYLKPSTIDMLRNGDIVIYFSKNIEVGLYNLISKTSTKHYEINKTPQIRSLILKQYGKINNDHIWTSAKIMKSVISSVANILSNNIPRAANIIKENAKNANDKLDKISIKMKDKLANIDGIVLSSHDFMEYFAHDYNIGYRYLKSSSSFIKADAKKIMSNQKGQVKCILINHGDSTDILEKISSAKSIPIVQVDGEGTMIDISSMNGFEIYEYYLNSLSDGVRNCIQIGS